MSIILSILIIALANSSLALAAQRYRFPAVGPQMLVLRCISAECLQELP